MSDNVVNIDFFKRASSVARALPPGGATLFNFAEERERHMSGKGDEAQLFRSTKAFAEYEGVGFFPIRVMMSLSLEAEDITIRHQAADWLQENCAITVLDGNDSPMGSRGGGRG